MLDWRKPMSKAYLELDVKDVMHIKTELTRLKEDLKLSNIKEIHPYVKHFGFQLEPRKHLIEHVEMIEKLINNTPLKPTPTIEQVEEALKYLEKHNPIIESTIKTILISDLRSYCALHAFFLE